MSARRLDDDDDYWAWRRPSPVVEQVAAPAEPVEITVLWCQQTLWGEGVYPCLRRQHPPGTHHWYDIRATARDG